MPSPSAPVAKPPTVIRATWAGEHRFDVGRIDGTTARIDASGKTGPGPVDTLLSALATCATVDVVDILIKRRTPVERLSVTVTGDRAPTIPARVTRLVLAFDMGGAGIDRTGAERAIDLAISKYCSVRSSLDPAIPVSFTLTLNGESGSTIMAGTLS